MSLMQSIGVFGEILKERPDPMWAWLTEARERQLQQEAQTFRTVSRLRRGEIGYRSLMGSGFAPRSRSVSQDAIDSDLPTGQAAGTTLEPDFLAPATSRSSLKWPFSTL